MITIKHRGNLKKTYRFLEKASKQEFYNKLEAYGREGVQALASATPIDSGETAQSWGYEITRTKDSVTITWTNSNVIDGVPVAILLQYGHGTRNGGYVQGRDYINPAIRPIFDKIAESAWREVVTS
jgi:hypothetical protein